MGIFAKMKQERGPSPKAAPGGTGELGIFIRLKGKGARLPLHLGSNTQETGGPGAAPAIST